MRVAVEELFIYIYEVVAVDDGLERKKGRRRMAVGKKEREEEDGGWKERKRGRKRKKKDSELTKHSGNHAKAA